MRYALERGHNVSIFTRGRTEPQLFRDAFRQVEHLVGDRADNLEALRGRSWDAVIDNSGARVAWTRDSAQLLKDRGGAYLYVSSTGVYLFPAQCPDRRAVARGRGCSAAAATAADSVVRCTGEPRSALVAGIS